jgi:hypothetical protein
MSGVADPPGPRKNEKPLSGHPDNMALLVERTEGNDGKASEHRVQLGNYRYFDLDRDGRFDGLEDRRNEEKIRSYILITQPDSELEMVRIETWNRKLNLVPITTEAYHTKTTYLFEKGNWRVYTLEDKRRLEGGGKKDPDK